MPKFDSSMSAMLDVFVFETSDLLEKLDDRLIAAEQEGLSANDIGEIFRIMHTVKGSASMMGLQSISKLAHSLEDLFSLIRDNPSISYDKERLFELLYDGSDSLKGEIESLTDESVPLSDFSDKISAVEAFADIMKGKPAAQNESGSDGYNANDIFSKDDDDKTAVFKVDFVESCLMPELRAMTLLGQLKNETLMATLPKNLDDDAAGEQIAAYGFIIKLKTDNPLATLEKIKNAIDVMDAQEVLPQVDNPQLVQSNEKEQSKETSQQQVKQSESKKSGESGANAIISVKLEKLDRLMRLSQEIVIAESEVLHSPDLIPYRNNIPNFDKSARELKKLTDELQDMVMSVRMVPISGAFSKMNRVVRDMNKTLKKNVRLVFEGEETEVDKPVSDMLGDPLMHLVRNAIDHGIEAPQEREAANKTELPLVTLSAYYDASDVIVKVADNGAGMNSAEILEKARQRGLLTKPDSEYTEKEIFDFILAPGFTTNKTVTEYSGRGVGMDVVKKNLEKLGGSLAVDSVFGEGSVFTIRVPMSLSISDCMGLMLCGQEYALPVTYLTEVFRAKKEQIVISPDGHEAVMPSGGGKLLRVIRLSEIFSLSGAVEELDEGIMLICQTAKGEAALFADDVTEAMQIVIKPFSPILASLGLKGAGFAGTSILGDGSIVLVLDTNEILKDGE